jgi:hypothetical protein
MVFSQCPLACGAATKVCCKKTRICWRKVEEEIQGPGEYLKNFADVFWEESFNELPLHWKWDHKIVLKEVHREVTSKIYPLSYKEWEELQCFLDKNLVMGQIRPSMSLFACPFFFRKKPNRTL